MSVLGVDESPLIEVVFGVYRKRKCYTVFSYFLTSRAFHISPLMVIFTLLLSVSNLKLYQ